MPIAQAKQRKLRNQSAHDHTSCALLDSYYDKHIRKKAGFVIVEKKRLQTEAVEGK
jgi:hypothetical protein